VKYKKGHLPFDKPFQFLCFSLPDRLLQSAERVSVQGRYFFGVWVRSDDLAVEPWVFQEYLFDSGESFPEDRCGKILKLFQRDGCIPEGEAQW
jgi:hypothetical protein